MIRKAAFFALLYFIQGAALAYFTNFQKPFLSEQGVSPSSIGLLTSILLLPFVFKVGFGAISDRISFGRWGRRRPYILLGLAMAFVGFLQAGRTSPALDFLAFGIFVCCASFGIALFDSAADGLALDNTRDSEQGAVQGAMMGGKSLGLIVVSTLMGSLVFEAGYAGAFNLLSLLSLGLLLVIAFGFPNLNDSERKLGSTGDSGWRTFLKTEYLWFALFGITYSMCSFGIDGIISLGLSRDLGVNAEDLGRAGSLRGLGAITGAGVFVLLSRKIDQERLSLLSIGGIVLGAALLWATLRQENYLIPIFLWGLLWSLQEVAYITWAMRLSLKGWEATAFAILMAISNLGTGLGDGVSTALLEGRTTHEVFGFLALAALMPVGIWLCFLGAKKRSGLPQHNRL